MGEQKRRLELVKTGAAETGRVPISVDTTLRLSRLFYEWQYVNRLTAAAIAAYVEGLTGVVESLDLGVPVTVAVSPTEQRIQIEVDFKARELVLPPPAPTEPAKEPSAEEPSAKAEPK